MPLNPIVVGEPFAQWGLDFIGMINPTFRFGHKWILTTTDYFTRWTKAMPLKNATEAEIVNFLKELVTRFGSPQDHHLRKCKSLPRFEGMSICT